MKAVTWRPLPKLSPEHFQEGLLSMGRKQAVVRVFSQIKKVTFPRL